MKTNIAKLILSLSFLSFSLTSSFLPSEALAQPLPSPPHSDPSLLGLSEIFAPILSLAASPHDRYAEKNREFILRDGTRLGGLLFIDESKGPRPLIIADFGLTSSRWSSLGAERIKDLINPGKINANFMVVDDVSGAAFFSANRNIGLGGYDAGRILIELADEIKREGIPFTTLHLWGESLGGLAALEAVIEDQRIEGHHFQSAITFSGVVDEVKSSTAVFHAFGRTDILEKNLNLSPLGKIFLADGVDDFNRLLEKDHAGLPTIGKNAAGDFYYKNFSDRLESIRATDWNSEVSRDSVESYIESSDALLKNISHTAVPVILVHSHNDPVVDYAQFKKFALEQKDNPKVLTLGTHFGSHCGFVGTYGADWVASLVNRAVSMN